MKILKQANDKQSHHNKSTMKKKLNKKIEDRHCINRKLKAQHVVDTIW